MSFKLVATIATAVALGSSGAALAGGPPPPPTLATCGLGDLTPAALTCVGFFKGNLIDGSPTDITAQKTDLALLGYTWSGTYLEKISPLGGSHTVDFTTLIKGISYVGFHFGGGTGSPGEESTAFYKIDGGAGLHEIMLKYNASSNAALYATNVGSDGPPPVIGGIGAVPEPAAWAMLVMGFGLVGITARRRSRAVAA